MAISLFTFPVHGETENEEKMGLLWKISGNGLSAPSYLLGTAHNFPGEFVYSFPRFEEAFDSIEQLIVEVDMLDSTKGTQIAAYTASLMKDRFLPDSVKYLDLVNETDLHLLDSFSLKYFKRTSDETRLRPAHLYNAMGIAMIGDLLEYIQNDSLIILLKKVKEGSLSMDHFLAEKAKEKRYSIIELETVQYQMELLLNPKISQEQAIRYLLATLKDYETSMKMSGAMFQAVYAQDLRGMADNMDKISQLSDLGDLYDDPINLKERNLNWIPVIKTAIQEKGTMIAVGAGHLPWEYGLINLLRKEGYVVEDFK